MEKKEPSFTCKRKNGKNDEKQENPEVFHALKLKKAEHESSV